MVVRFRANLFSAANGNVTAYTLVLGEEPRPDTPAPLPSWRDVQRLPVWPPYQVLGTIHTRTYELAYT